MILQSNSAQGAIESTEIFIKFGKRKQFLFDHLHQDQFFYDYLIMKRIEL